MGVSKQKQAEMERRRRIVAANLLAGVTYREMAQALEVSLGTIASDVAIVLGRWRREQIDSADDHVQVAVKRLDTALNAIWDDVKSGNVSAIDRLLSIEQRRAKLLGYDAPDRLEVSGQDGAPVTHAHMEIPPLDRLDDAEYEQFKRLWRKGAGVTEE